MVRLLLGAVTTPWRNASTIPCTRAGYSSEVMTLAKRSSKIEQYLINPMPMRGVSNSKVFTYEKDQRVLVPNEPNGTAGTVLGRADHVDHEEQYHLMWIGQSGMMRDGWFTLTAI